LRDVGGGEKRKRRRRGETGGDDGLSTTASAGRNEEEEVVQGRPTPSRGELLPLVSFSGAGLGRYGQELVGRTAAAGRTMVAAVGGR
jgi:hypothetical protein